LNGLYDRIQGLYVCVDLIVDNCETVYFLVHVKRPVPESYVIIFRA
jgi:hypothetical protein